MTKQMESKRLVFKPFSALSAQERQIVGDSWANPFNARYNAMKDPYASVNDLASTPEPTFNNIEDYYDSMYFRVAFEKESGKIVGTCRFGKYHSADTDKTWDFGFNVLLNSWYKGYGVEMVAAIIEYAKKCSVTEIIGGADIENYGSYKAMVKNGFEYVGYDSDGDYRYILDTTKEKASEQDIKKTWNAHIERTKKDLGEEKFQNLEYINAEIGKMVARIQNGEDEKTLVKEYFEKLNDIEEFKFC